MKKERFALLAVTAAKMAMKLHPCEANGDIKLGPRLKERDFRCFCKKCNVEFTIPWGDVRAAADGAS